jgi:hypothetical protein
MKDIISSQPAYLNFKEESGNIIFGVTPTYVRVHSQKMTL